MKRTLTLLTPFVVILSLASFTLAKEKKAKPAPLTGTWECASHGGSQGDMPFTLHLEQNDEAVTGSVESPIGGTEISSATLKKNVLEIHIDTSQGNYLLSAKLKRDQLTDGQWSGGSNDEKGTWEGKKSVQSQP